MSFVKIIYIQDLARILFEYLEGEGFSTHGLAGCNSVTLAAATQCVRRIKLRPSAPVLPVRTLLIRLKDSPDFISLSIGCFRVGAAYLYSMKEKMIVPEGVQFLHNLEELKVTNTRPSPLDTGSMRICTRLQYLTKLDISHCKVTKLDGIEVLQQLRCLNASNNSLYGFSNKRNSLSSLVNLRELDISFNFLAEVDMKGIPASLEVFNMSSQMMNQGTTLQLLTDTHLEDAALKLKSLDTSNTRLHFQGSLASLANLEQLIMRNCQLSSIVLIGLGKLVEVDISFNHFNVLPIISSSNLQRFAMSNNSAPVSVPAWFGIQFEHTLQSLDLSSNTFLFIDESLQNLRKLKELRISSEFLEGEIPHWFIDFQNSVK